MNLNFPFIPESTTPGVPTTAQIQWFAVPRNRKLTHLVPSIDYAKWTEVEILMAKFVQLPKEKFLNKMLAIVDRILDSNHTDQSVKFSERQAMIKAVRLEFIKLAKDTDWKSLLGPWLSAIMPKYVKRLTALWKKKLNQVNAKNGGRNANRVTIANANKSSNPRRTKKSSRTRLSSTDSEDNNVLPVQRRRSTRSCVLRRQKFAVVANEKNDGPRYFTRAVIAGRRVKIFWPKRSVLMPNISKNQAHEVVKVKKGNEIRYFIRVAIGNQFVRILCPKRSVSIDYEDSETEDDEMDDEADEDYDNMEGVEHGACYSSLSNTDVSIDDDDWETENNESETDENDDKTEGVEHAARYPHLLSAAASIVDENWETENNEMETDEDDDKMKGVEHAVRYSKLTATDVSTDDEDWETENDEIEDDGIEDEMDEDYEEMEGVEHTSSVGE